MHIRDIEKLKVWLLKKLQPLCDADPAALSKYIVALLRKEKPRSALKELCVNQLEVFLSKETPSFVDKLFRSLDSESYLTGADDHETTPPLNASSSNSSGDSGRSGGGVVNSESPLLGSDRVVIDHRRQSEDIRHREVDDDDRDFRRAHYRHDSSPSFTYPRPGGVGGTNTAIERNKKKIEIEPPRRSIRQRLGYREEERRRRRPRSRSRSRSSTPDRNSSPSPSTTPTGELDNDRGHRKRVHSEPMGGVSNDLKPVAKRQRCKDYDEKGMCLLGEQCPYDHGNDPLVITGIPSYPPPPFPLTMPPPPPPNLPPFPQGSSGLLLPSLVPPSGGASPSRTDGYNPEDPSLTAGTNPPPLPPPPPPPSLLPPQMPLRPAFPPSLPGLPGMPPLPPPLHSNIPNPALPSAFTPVNAKAPPIAPPIPRPPVNNFGGMGGVRHPSRPSDTIVLRKVPRDLNTITKLSGYFERFGTIVNLQVRYENCPESATVQFSSPAEAKAAHDCTEAVLNNRFIRVYYLKNTGPLSNTSNTSNTGNTGNTGHNRTDHRNNITPFNVSRPPLSTQYNAIPTTQSTTYVTPSQAPPTSSTMTSHVQSTYNQPRKSQKPVKPAANLKRLELQKKTQSLLESQIQQQKLLLMKLEKSGKSLSSEERDKVMETLKSLSSNILKLKDTLSSATKTASIKPAPPRGKRHTSLSSPTTPTVSLQEKADQLRNEAHKLGILAPTSTTVAPIGSVNAPPTSGRDPPSDVKKKVDNKTRQLLVINVEDKDALVKYFESFGGLNQIERDPENSKNYIFTFKNRTIAEKAVKGSLFQGKPLIMKWYIPKAPPTPPTPITPTMTTPTVSTTTPASVLEVHTADHVTDHVITIEETSTRKTVPDCVTTTKSPPSSLTLLNELQDLQELEAELQVNTPLEVLTPNQSKPRVVHLLDDDDDEEFDERSWRH